MITITLSINGTNYSQFIKYPISYTNKNLDESLNLLELKLFGMITDVPFKPNTIGSIVILQDNVPWLTTEMVLTGDIVERIGASDKYIHKLAFVEKTYLLTLEVLPDMTITRAEPLCWKDGKNNPDYVSSSSVCTTFGGTYFAGYQPTLLEVAEKLIKYSEGNFSNTLGIATGTAAILSAIQAPELTFTRYTTLEALRLVFGIAKIVPYIRTGATLEHVGIRNETDTITSPTFVTEAFSGDTYRTRLYSPVENFIGGGDFEGSIVEPMNGWTTPRSDRTDITNDVGIIKTSRPIYKIERLSLMSQAYYTRVYNDGFGTANYYTVYTPIANLPQEWLNPNVVTNEGINLKDYVYEKSAYDLLANTTEGKGKAIYYTQRKPNIEGLTIRPDVVTGWFPAKQSIRKIVYDIAYGPSPQVKPEYVSAFLTYMSDLWVAEFGALTPGVIYRYGFMPMGIFTDNNTTGTSIISRGFGGIMIDDNIVYSTYSDINIPVMRFNIQYTPYINTKIFTYKERKETDEPQFVSTMTYNQSANTVSDEVLGELHDKVVKRNAAPTKTFKVVENSLNNIPYLGVRAGNYIVSAQDITINADNAVVEYVLSKDYAKLNQYVAVLEKFRQFAIPSEQVVDRQLTIERFGKLSFTQATNTSNITVEDYAAQDEVNILRLNTNATYTLPGSDTVIPTPLQYIPPTNFAFNNALVFEGQYPTQSLAGFKSEPYEGNETTRRLEAAQPYANNLGRFTQFTTITFAHNTVGTFSIEDSHNLPTLTDSVDNTILSLSLVDVDKDARERLSVSLIIHHIDETGIVHINKNFAKQNGLIGGPGFTGQSFTWKYLTTKPYDEGSKATPYGVALSSGAVVTIVGTSLRFAHPQSTINTNAAAYALCDANDNILFWVDESVVANTTQLRPIFLNLSNTY